MKDDKKEYESYFEDGIDKLIKEYEKFKYDDIPFSEYNNPVEESQPTETN